MDGWFEGDGFMLRELWRRCLVLPDVSKNEIVDGMESKLTSLVLSERLIVNRVII